MRVEDSLVAGYLTAGVTGAGGRWADRGFDVHLDGPTGDREAPQGDGLDDRLPNIPREERVQHQLEPTSAARLVMRVSDGAGLALAAAPRNASHDGVDADPPGGRWRAR